MSIFGKITEDTDDAPADQGVCANCWRAWIDHVGWRCPVAKAVTATHFRDVIPEYRYRVAATTDAPPKPPPLDDWRTWRDAGRPAGMCVCWIPVEQCRYHKSREDT